MKAAKSLLKRARQWDEDALAEVYDTYAPAIYRYAYRLTGHQETAQDIVAETFHRFLVALKNSGGPEQHLSGWLYRVAHNLVVDLYRRQPAQTPTSLDDAPEMAAADVHKGNMYAKPFEARIVYHEDVDRLRSALKQLTSLQQQVIVLRFLEGLSLEETAQVVERTVGAVKALQHRGLTALRRILEEDNGV